MSACEEVRRADRISPVPTWAWADSKGDWIHGWGSMSVLGMGPSHLKLPAKYRPRKQHPSPFRKWPCALGLV